MICLFSFFLLFTSCFLFQKVSTPIFELEEGTYTNEIVVTITCATDGATIKYTIDSSEPSPTHGTTYLSPIIISTTTTIKVMAYKAWLDNSDIATAKYTINPIEKWTRLLGASGAETTSYGIAIDSANNIYVTGYTTGNLDGLTITGNPDLFVVKYNSSGDKQWTRLLGVSGAQTTSYGIAIDSTNNIYVTGSTDGNLDGQTNTGSYDLFITNKLGE